MEANQHLAAISAPTCGACDVVNSPEARFCKGCGESLYETCFECSQPVLLTQSFCESCGADLEKALRERHEQNAQCMKQAVAKTREYEFDRAITLLNRVANHADYRFAEAVANAKRAIAKVEALRSQTEQSVDNTIARANEACAAGDKPEAARLLATIPEQMRSREVQKLLDSVQSFTDQKNELETELRSAIQQKDWQLVGGLIDQLHDLVPKEPRYLKLAQQVSSRLRAAAQSLAKEARYHAALEQLDSVPHLAQDDGHLQWRERLEDLHWYASQFEAEPYVTPMLGRLAVRFAKEASGDQKAQQLVKELASQLKQAPRPSRSQFPTWKSSADCGFGGQARHLTSPKRIKVGDHPAIKAAPGRFNVAYGLAIQGLGRGRVSDSFFRKKSLLAGLPRRHKRVWGIDVGTSAVKAVCVEEVDEVLVVRDAWFDEYKTPLSRVSAESESEGPLAEAIGKLVKEKDLQGVPVWANVNACKLISRFVRLPPVKDKAALSLLTQEATQRIPIDVDELALVQWVAEVHEDDIQGRPGVVVAARRNVISDRLDQLAECGLHIDGLQADSVALVNFLAHEFVEVLDASASAENKCRDDKTPTVLLIDAGAASTSMILVSQETHWCWTMESGGEDLTSLVARASKVTAAEAEKLKRNLADMSSPSKQFALVERRQEELRSRLETAFADALRQNGRFDVIESYGAGGTALLHGWLRRLMLA